MSNDELKKKIAQIIADYFCPQRNEHKNLWGDDRLCYSKMNFAECERVAECTDALIASGIGDVKEAEHRAEVAERALEIVMERFACNVCDNLECPYYEGVNYNIKYCAGWWIQQAEKELAEEGKDEQI